MERAGTTNAADSLLSYERRYWEHCSRGCLVGIDEVGRGPLAGPVVAAAVMIPRPVAEKALQGPLKGLIDSKQLTPALRNRYAEELKNNSRIKIGVGWTSAAEVDDLNVLYATYRAMARAVKALDIKPDHALVDGLPVQGLPCESTSIIRGDSQSLLIAAASVIAKVERDNRMAELSARYPAYGFASNKGYGTVAHIEALMRIGPCPEHRMSFRPVAESQQLHLMSAASAGAL